MLTTMLGQPPAPSTNVIVAGCGKLFVGEIVEECRAIQSERGETGPIMPDHIQAAFQRYMKKNPCSQSSLYKPRLF